MFLFFLSVRTVLQHLTKLFTFWDLLGVSVLRSWQLHSVLLRMHLVVYLDTPKVIPLSLVYQVIGLFLVFQLGDSFLHLHQHLFEPRIESCQQTATKCKFNIQNQPQMFFFKLKKEMRYQASLGHKTACQLSNDFRASENNDSV